MRSQRTRERSPRVTSLRARGDGADRRGLGGAVRLCLRGDAGAERADGIRYALRSTRADSFLPNQRLQDHLRPEGTASRIAGVGTERLLDPQQLVVFGHPIRA